MARAAEPGVRTDASTAAAPGWEALDRRVALRLFAACACLYLLTAGGHFYSWDDLQKFQALDAVMRHGSFAIQDGWAEGTDGHRFAWFPLGASLLMLPGYLLGSLASWLGAGAAAGELARVAISFQNAAISAAIVTLAFVASRAAGAPRRPAVAAALTLGFATMIWPYAKTAWSEPAAGLAVFGGLLALWHGARQGPGRGGYWLALAGAALGGAVLIRQELAIVAVLALAWLRLHKDVPGERPWHALARFAAPLAVAAVISGWYEWLRYGQLLELPNYFVPQARIDDRLAFTLENLWHYTLNPSQAAIWFSPPLLLALLGWPALRARQPALAKLILVTLTPLLAFYIIGWGNSTWAWGLRYTYVFLPFSALPIALLLAGGQRRRLAATAIGVGLAVQLLAIPYDANYLYERELAKTPGAVINALFDDPRRGPIVLAARDLPMVFAAGARALTSPPRGESIALALREARKEGVPDFWWLLYWTTPVPRWALLAAMLGLAAAAIAAGLAAKRALDGT